MARLEALGRTLPKKLPLPEPPSGKGLAGPRSGGQASSEARAQRPTPPVLPSPGQGGGWQGASAKGAKAAGAQRPEAGRARGRHPLEEAREPEDLFRALIQASADGTVPPHLLDQLRELEASRRPSSPMPPSPSPAMGPSAATTPGPKSRTLSPGGGSGTDRKGGPTPTGPRRGSRNAGQARGQANDDQALYTAFAQLLLEDDSDA